MLVEYALIPDIFDSSNYSSPELCDVHLQHLKQPLLEEALVRDLCDGGWHKCFNNETTILHPRAKELIRKLVTQNRLRCFRSIEISSPQSDYEWCKEAIASHQQEPLNGIISTNDTTQRFNKSETVLSSIQKLNNAKWWRERSPSVRPYRNIEGYLKYLHKILNQANHIMFIDPYLDPTRFSYEKFVNILCSIRQEMSPLIEIHRVSRDGSGENKKYPTEQEWENRYYQKLHQPLAESGLTVNVFIWDIPKWGELEFHDRYLITNIFGISLSNGFDVSRNNKAKTTWTRLGKKDREEIEREFDPKSNRHRIKYSFSIGLNTIKQ
jgi:hypothetical protein